MKRFLLLLLTFPVSVSAGQMLQCPSSIMIEKNAATPVGWRFFSDSSPNALERIGFFSGDPSEGASLVPDAAQTKGQESKDEWRFLIRADEVIWVGCYYSGTDAFLARQLDKGVSKCAVTYNTTKFGSRISVKGIYCD